jgi:hypothetical protein
MTEIVIFGFIISFALGLLVGQAIEHNHTKRILALANQVVALCVAGKALDSSEAELKTYDANSQSC